MTPLTIIITVLNDQQEANATIKSIRDTAGDYVDILVVDDCSKIPLTLDDPRAMLIRNPYRTGVAASRHIAACHASGETLLIIDSHMRFENNGWLQKLLQRVEGRPATAHCARCLGLSPTNMDVTKHAGEYQGASFNFYGPDKNNPKLTQLFQGVWLEDKQGDDYQIPCLMGACYAVSRDFFLHVGGLRSLRGYGSDEEYLSLKWWLAGGDIRIMKEVRIGHQFREATPYQTDRWMFSYNKLFAIETILPEGYREQLVAQFPKTVEVRQAIQELQRDANHVLAERAYNQSIFARTFPWFLSHFNLPFPQ